LIPVRQAQMLANPILSGLSRAYQDTGAPEEIRTPDPQIRSLGECVDLTRISCKPGQKPPIARQLVSCRFANRASRSPFQTGDPENRSPGAAGTATGAKQVANQLHPKNIEPTAPVQVAERTIGMNCGRVRRILAASDNLPDALTVISPRANSRRSAPTRIWSGK
jgi:hypothetical protein